MKRLATIALGEPLFREYLPAAAADPDGSRAQALLDEITARLRDLLRSEELAADLRAARAHLIRRGRAP